MSKMDTPASQAGRDPFSFTRPLPIAQDRWIPFLWLSSGDRKVARWDFVAWFTGFTRAGSKRSLSPEMIPRHVGVMCDGNRRWARSAGLLDVASGHQKGADKIFELLEWCREAGVEVVTLWLLSTDNLTRPAAELEPLLRIIEDTVPGSSPTAGT